MMNYSINRRIFVLAVVLSAARLLAAAPVFSSDKTLFSSDGDEMLQLLYKGVGYSEEETRAILEQRQKEVIEADVRERLGKFKKRSQLVKNVREIYAELRSACRIKSYVFASDRVYELKLLLADKRLPADFREKYMAKTGHYERLVRKAMGEESPVLKPDPSSFVKTIEKKLPVKDRPAAAQEKPSEEPLVLKTARSVLRKKEMEPVSLKSVPVPHLEKKRPEVKETATVLQKEKPKPVSSETIPVPRSERKRPEPTKTARAPEPQKQLEISLPVRPVSQVGTELYAKVAERKTDLSRHRENIEQKLTARIDAIYLEGISLYDQKNFVAAYRKFKTINEISPGYEKTGQFMEEISRQMLKPDS